MVRVQRNTVLTFHVFGDERAGMRVFLFQFINHLKYNKMIIGISGKMKTGKDTAAKIIANKLLQSGQDYRIIRFASTLKSIVAMALGVNHEQLENREFKNMRLGGKWMGNFTKKPFLTPRIIMQQVGRKMREIHPNFWVNMLDSLIEIDGECIYIIPDVRFENEVNYIESNGGFVIRLQRPLNQRFPQYPPINYSHEPKFIQDQYEKDCPIARTLIDPSETALDNKQDWDYLIDNNRSLQDLEIKILNIL